MRYKFTFEKDIKNDGLKIFEAGEVDNNFVVMYEGAFGLADLKEASKKGAEFFIEKLRVKNFFPNGAIANKLYEATIDFFSKKSEEKFVVEYEDSETLATEEMEEEDIEVDDLLSSNDENSGDEIKEIDTEDDTPKFTPEDNSEHEK